ncbi:uncharacterized protein LOC113472121 isoform X2 [Diaphorina citri]|uniref:Uncharacterized protein LOC113472121 isoform X1 n=1 Tax=Diaphorina citri TaxID=121845 RepID=A0A3Q0JK24_DIACI|nr:uncharacterized protein LOC113472121 isoform X1 [Diaphorina citri]XP_026687518.1 uncharacterized protein LOC113472121 isoform X2 [Diaphorina citri]
MNHKPKKLRATGDKIIVQLPLKIQYQINIFDREVTDFLERYLLNESDIRLGRYEQDGTLWKQDPNEVRSTNSGNYSTYRLKINNLMKRRYNKEMSCILYR